VCSEAKQKFQAAMEMLGHTPALMYNEALCSYKMKSPADALKTIAQIIEKVCPTAEGNMYARPACADRSGDHQ
jgi:hypothetical protein